MMPEPPRPLTLDDYLNSDPDLDERLLELLATARRDEGGRPDLLDLRDRHWPDRDVRELHWAMDRLWRAERVDRQGRPVPPPPSDRPGPREA